MTPKHPPRLARWVLEHLITDEQKVALSGDLLEEFRSGRSIGWYWRQVAMAVIVSMARTLRLNWFALAFSALWVLPLPALEIYVLREMQLVRFFPQRWSYPWPYSTICDFGLTIGWKLLYLWLGITFCQIFFAIATRRTSVRQLVKGLCVSMAVYVTTYLAMLAYFLAFPHMYAVDLHRVNPISLVLKPGLMLINDIPFIVAMLSGILLATLTRQRRTTEVAP
ncbi:MAG TPA: hypothetical protein VGK36_10600 [Candidatus Angelobacter sp.]|jgi:hypothetical protein